MPPMTSKRSRVVQILIVHWCFSSTENQISKQSLAKYVTHLMVD